MNRIIEVRITLVDNGWVVSTTKEFAPENGGGVQTFTENGGSDVHRALDVAFGMVTLSPAQRTDLNEEDEIIYGPGVAPLRTPWNKGGQNT